MKERLQQQRIKKIKDLSDELKQWQQIVVDQQQSIDRLNVNFSALVAVLNGQKRFEKFDIKKFDRELDKILKARFEQAKAMQAKLNGEAHPHPHADSHPT